MRSIYYKAFTFLITFCILSTHIMAQSLSMSMYIEWKEKNLYMFDSHNYKMPYLKITYTNNTQDSIYFYENKPISKYIDFNFGEAYKPSFQINDTVTDLTEEFINAMKRIPIKKFNIHKKYHHDINFTDFYLLNRKSVISFNSPNHLFDIAWVMDKTLEILRIQDELTTKDSTLQLKVFCDPTKKKITAKAAYKIIYNKKWLSEDSLNKMYSINELEKDSMDKNLRNNNMSNRVPDQLIKDIQGQFIYLKPHGMYTQEYDLTPLFIVGGDYKFFATKKRFPSYEIINTAVNSLSTKNSRLKENDFIYKFPKKYQGYKLYTGLVNGSKATLCIDKSFY